MGRVTQFFQRKFKQNKEKPSQSDQGATPPPSNDKIKQFDQEESPFKTTPLPPRSPQVNNTLVQFFRVLIFFALFFYFSLKPTLTPVDQVFRLVAAAAGILEALVFLNQSGWKRK